MAFLSEMFHTSAEVWNKYGTRKGAWRLDLPYLPYLPYLFPYTHVGARVRTRVCVCVFINFSMEGMEVWKSGLNIGLQLSIPVPYLNLGMEGGFYG
ncbi:MAG: hypothetical protein K2P74_06850 [Nitrosomonas sp.]|nr:hypothetical protein [Nitrosomonas sp.]